MTLFVHLETLDVLLSMQGVALHSWYIVLPALYRSSCGDQSEHLAQVSLPQQLCRVWPDLWHLKSTGTGSDICMDSVDHVVKRFSKLSRDQSQD